MSSKNKGGNFERQIARELSLWWTKGKRDDACWRTASSGGKATINSKSGKNISTGYGDLTYTDPEMKPFFDMVVVELKKGYNTSTIQDFFDRGAKSAIPQYQHWFDDIRRDKKNADVPYWMIIHKRDRRESVVLVSEALEADFSMYCYHYKKSSSDNLLYLEYGTMGKYLYKDLSVFIFPYDAFFKTIDKEFFTSRFVENDNNKTPEEMEEDKKNRV